MHLVKGTEAGTIVEEKLKKIMMSSDLPLFVEFGIIDAILERMGNDNPASLVCTIFS
jgi:hypothetical protein